MALGSLEIHGEAATELTDISGFLITMQLYQAVQELIVQLQQINMTTTTVMTEQAMTLVM